MEITVIGPSEQWLDSAGVRIRYLRLQPALERLGHRIVLRVIDTIRVTDSFKSDAYLFCKCYDVRAVLLAQAIRAKGLPPGIDVFDDYFSQSGDPRLVHHRRWLRQMRAHVSFVLCATPTMAQRLADLTPDLRIHVLNDPAPPFDQEAVAVAVDRKAARARETGIADLAWFGMGDNPYFPVGLDDLSAWGGVLTELRAAGLVPRLRMLTNLRALTTQGLEAIARLPVPVQLDEWSIEAEAALVEDSLAVFLPVNAQPFSTVKSPNRAVTALTGGAQLLTAGYPLYDALGDFAYRSGIELARDLGDDRLRLRRATLPRLAALLDREGDPDLEAERLAGFIVDPNLRRPRVAGSQSAAFAVIHGVQSGKPVHVWAQRSGYLSIASPFADPKIDYDLRFKESAGPKLKLWAFLSERACGLLDPALVPAIKTSVAADGKLTRSLVLGAEALPGFGARGIAERIALYPTSIAATRRLAKRLMPSVRILLSEMTSPFDEASDAEVEA